MTMLFLCLSAMLIANGGGAELSETVNCDMARLDRCGENSRINVHGLPSTKEELDARCQAYQTVMSCIDAWKDECLTTEQQKLSQQQMGGAQALMRFLCTNDTMIRKDYLKDIKCWGHVSPQWTACDNNLKEAVREIGDRAQQVTYINRNAELCCARDMFITCVANAGRSCSNSAGMLLHRMACLLAQDLAACNQQSRAYCSASSPPLAAPLLTTLGFILYPPRM